MNTFLDPACGCGHILLEAFRVLIQHTSHSCKLEKPYSPWDSTALTYEDQSADPLIRQILWALDSVHGWDIDARVVRISKASLILEASHYLGRALTEQEVISTIVLFHKHLRIYRLGGHGTLETSVFIYGQPSESLPTMQFQSLATNPPYLGKRLMPPSLSSFAKQHYPHTRCDLFSMFIERMLSLLLPGGYGAFLTMHSWMFLPSHEMLRELFLKQAHLISILHLGTKAFRALPGEVVQAMACGYRNHISDTGQNSEVTARIFDLRSCSEKESPFLTLNSEGKLAPPATLFNISPSSFSHNPKKAFIYWMRPSVIKLFDQGMKLGEICRVRQGLATTDNKRFVRYWWEVGKDSIEMNASSIASAKFSGKRWFPYTKGGQFRRWAGNLIHVVDWFDDRAEIKRNITQKYPYLKGNTNYVAKNQQCYFREGLSWTFVGSGRFSARYMEPGTIFDVGGSAIFCHDEDRPVMLSILCSEVAQLLLNILIPFQKKVLTFS